jgi:hypothetical protein
MEEPVERWGAYAIPDKRKLYEGWLHRRKVEGGMTEGDEMALQSQWVDLLRFEREQRMLEVAKESKEARYGSDVSCSGDERTGKE